MRRRRSSLRQLILLLGLITLAAWGGGVLALSRHLPAERGGWLGTPALELALLLLSAVAVTTALLVRIQHRRESELEDAHARRARLIVDAAVDAIITFTHEGRIESFNSAAARLFGYAPEEVIGEQIGLLITAASGRTFNSAMRQMVHTGGAHVLFDDLVFEGRHKDGRAIPIEMGVSKVIDEDRRLYVQIIRDLTERRQAERQRQLQFEVARILASKETLAEAGPAVLEAIGRMLNWRVGILWQVCSESQMLRAAALWHEPETGLLLVRDARETSLPAGTGLAGQVWTARSLRWVADLTAETGNALAARAVEGGLRAVLAWPIELAGQVLGVLEFYAPTMMAPEDPLLRCLFPVATQLGQFLVRKQGEADLRRAHDTAEEANRAKSEFLANVSHEIRTPLNGILGLTELTLADETLPPAQRERLQLIEASGNTLLALLNDLLDFAKIEATRMVLEEVPFELRQTLEPTLKTLAVRARQKQLHFTCQIDADLPAWLVGDPLRLQQVLLNLVGNAIKFTPAGEVGVRLSLAARTPREVVLHGAVRDTGIGIAAHKQEMVFEAFGQADSSRTRKYGGTGLGLTITARLVGLMGGRIWLDSEPGKGSTFHFTACLGLAEAASALGLASTPSPQGVAERPSAQGAAPVMGRKILVAEDNPANRILLELILQKRRHAVTFACTGPEVLTAARTDRFDLILMDVQLPEMDGLEATRQVQALYREQGHDPPIVALTAFAGEEDRLRCLEAGMHAYLAKPVQPQELLRLLDEMLRPPGQS